MLPKCDNKIILTDTAMSRWMGFGGQPAYLEITEPEEPQEPEEEGSDGSLSVDGFSNKGEATLVSRYLTSGLDTPVDYQTEAVQVIQEGDYNFDDNQTTSETAFSDIYAGSDDDAAYNEAYL